MNRWVIYSTCSIVSLCSIVAVAPPVGAADLTVPAPPAASTEASDGPAVTAIDALRRSTPA
ncbi:MAG: hypothetical protein ACHQ8D_19090 [Candidatus Rokuibacteriota bacterium]|jgi:hypothetical protein